MTVDVPGVAADEAAVTPEALDPADPEEGRSRRRKAFLLFFLLFLLAGLLTIAIWYLLFRQPIAPAIPILPDMRLPTYTTAMYGVDGPLGLAVSPDGDRIYIAQTESERVLVVLDAGGNLIRKGTLPIRSPEESEHVPLYVAIDPLTSEVYASDRPTGSIYVYDREGVYLRTLTLADDTTGWQPMGLAFDDAGLLYIADIGSSFQRIRVVGRDAKVIRTIGENDRMSFINGIAVDRNGYLYVADSNNGRLMVYSKDGALVAQVGRGVGNGKLGLPRGVAVVNDRVHVVDSTGQGVSIFRTVSDPAAGRLEYIGFIGGQGLADGQFAFPNGVAIDGRGRVYVADTANDRIQLWSY